MNWAYFHIVINHFPIVGVIIGTLLLLAGLVFRNQGIKLSGLGTILFAALTAILAYQTGNPAEDAVKGLPGVAESLINHHEDIATIGMYLIIPAGLMAAMSFYSLIKKERSTRFLIILTLSLSLISSGMMVYVGHTGGQIRHSEFRSESSKQNIIDHQNENVEKD
jgi:uncharacterized membrane protein